MNVKIIQFIHAPYESLFLFSQRQFCAEQFHPNDLSNLVMDKMHISEAFNRYAVHVAMRAGRSAEEIAEFHGIPLADVNIIIEHLMTGVRGKNEVVSNNIFLFIFI